MKTGKSIYALRLGVLFVMLCIFGITAMAEAAAPVSQVPTGPRDINGNWATPDYYTTANWANSPPMAKFVDTLPGLTAANANNLGQYLPVAVPDKTTYPGSDYYIIELREYQEQLHSDLNKTTLRGYVQVDANGNDVAPIHYLGPIIVAERDRPVRMLFRNKLPTGSGGDLFIPVDTTVMGAGQGPMTVGGQPCDNTIDGNTCASYTQNRADIHLHGGRTPWISDGTPHQWIVPAGESTLFTSGVSLRNVPDMPDPGPGASTYYLTNQQSARLMFYHDHAFGITRLNVYSGEAAGYLITDQYEKDLVDRGILPADQIPLIIQDRTFVNAANTTKYIYNPATGLFDTPITVPAVRATDPLWNWGSGPADANGIKQPVTGDLWMPHVYLPAQQPTGSATGGVNPFGRWMYGPWFFPATVITKGPVTNPYYDPNCGSANPFELAQCQTPGQPPLIPGTPHPSMGMEAFQDSIVVNGTAFPSLTVDPRAYRFRILNAANDRFQNLNFYVADPAQVSPDPRLTVAGKSNLTEVKMVPAALDLAIANNWPPNWPVDGRAGGVPDPGLCLPGGINCPNFGPTFLQIGTEGGFLPNPVAIPHQPITYITDPTAFWVGNVDKMALALGPAERADVIVDFSAFAGKTLILYNDAPAAWPAGVVTYDYYTGAPDLRDVGGYGTGGLWDPITGTWAGGTGPLVGYAPNTRTVLQVIVRPTLSGPGNTYSQVNLEKEFTAAAPVTAVNPTPAKTLFERAQEPIIVGQAAYSPAYPNSYFPTNFPWEGVNQINDSFLQFVTLAGEQVKLPTEPKGIHDEMGASFDPVYGRMSGNLAMQMPNPTTLNALLITYGYNDIPSEVINNSIGVNVEVLPGLPGVPGTVKDGTQIWKISHNGVDTHPIHFHIFDVQLINRVGWDGQLLMPEPNELGWKDTVKISPLEDTIVAVRPRAPSLPFGIPNSLRPLNPAIPIDSAMGFTPLPINGSAWPFFSSIDWTTGQAYLANDPLYPYPNFKGVVTNVLYDFGWEYVWHCHILSHEEMDMMRSIILRVPASTPPAFDAQANPVNGTVQITWNDPTPIDYANLNLVETYRNPANEIGFNVYRSIDNGTTFNKLNTAALLANSTSYTDTAPVSGAVYQVEAFNANGSTFSSSSRAMTMSLSATGGPFTSPGPVGLRANIPFLPPGLTITKVDFYNGTTLLGTDTVGTSQFFFSWTNVPQGVYTITAKATDNLGGVTSAAPITVTVSGTVTPDFTIAGSAAGPDIGFCETITLTSTSSTTSGSIASYSWSTGGTAAVETLPAGMIPGTYPVTLTVTNTNGEIALITKNVVIVNHAPVAIPGGPYTVSPGGSITLTGSGTDPDSCNTNPLTYAWNVDNKGPFDYFTANPTIAFNTLLTALGAGMHTMTLQVTDSNGGIGTATTTLNVMTAPADPASITVLTSTTAVTNPVSWGASATAGVTYFVEEATDAAFTTNMRQVYTGTALTTNVTVSVSGTYYYRVKASKVGYTNDSNWVNSLPSVVTLTVATPSSFWVRTSTTLATNPISWGASATAGVTYVVEEATDTAFTTNLRQVYSGTAQAVNVTVAGSGTYYYRAKATKTGYTDSAWRNSLPSVVAAAVAAPSSFWVRTSTTLATNPISWGASATTGATYVVEEATDAAFTTNRRQVYSGTAQTVNVTIAVSGTYYYRAKATKTGYMDSTWTNSLPSIVTLAVAPPSSFWVRTSTNLATNPISWGASATNGVTYVVEEATDTAFTTNLRQVYSGTAQTINVTVATSGTYYYRAKATLAGFPDSTWKNSLPSVVTIAAAPPSSFWVRTSTTVATNPISWGASATAGVTYVVEEATDAAFTTNLRQVYSGTAQTVNVTVPASGTYYYRAKATLVGLQDSTWKNSLPSVVTLP